MHDWNGLTTGGLHKQCLPVSGIVKNLTSKIIKGNFFQNQFCIVIVVDDEFI